MPQKRIPAVFMRGGTSRALFFLRDHLPQGQQERSEIFLKALGSPDPYGRQLDGLGGGVSSLSKACIVGPSESPGIDVEYTFAQVAVSRPEVDWSGNCGNCAAAVGPFAIDEGLVEFTEGETIVRIRNTNTTKIIVAHVPVSNGEAAVSGEYEMQGVPGCGARIVLEFLEPGGAVTGALLPTGNARDHVEGVWASLVDAANPMVFVRAPDVGLAATEDPSELDARPDVLGRLEIIRRTGARLMGMPPSDALPKVAIVGCADSVRPLKREGHDVGGPDVVARVISMGVCHRAFALTAGMCLAVAARIDGTVVNEVAASRRGDLILAHPSGVLPISAEVHVRDGKPWAEKVTVFRTARRLMEGFVRIPE